MGFSSGTFSVVYNWTTESGAPPIEIAKLDTQHADFATGLSNCILRDGSGLPTAAIPWNSQNLTGVAQLEAARFVPTGSTVPSNGMYLPAANTVAFASNTTLRGSVNATGNWTLAAPSSGAALAVTGLSTGTAQTWTDGTVTAGVSFGSSIATFGATSNHATQIISNNTQRVLVAAVGNVTINAPASGAHTINGVAGASAGLLLSGASDTRFRIENSGDSNRGGYFADTGSAFRIGTNSGVRGVEIAPDSVVRFTVGVAGNVTVNAPSSGDVLTVNSLNGQGLRIATTAGSTGAAVYFSQSGQSVAAIYQSASASDLRAFVNGADRIVVAAAGNVTINAPSSGTALTVTGVAGGVIQSWGDGTVAGNITLSGGGFTFGTTNSTPVGIQSNGTTRVVVAAAGNVTISGAVATPPVVVTFSATAMTVDCRLSNVFTTTFTANVTTAPTLSNPQDGQTINWFITQDSGGGRTMTWPSTFRWPGGVAGVLSTAANAVDLMVATYRSGPNAWYASLSKGFA